MGIRVRMKPYIKPFESELAMLELKALANIENINEQQGYVYFETPNEDIILEKLKDRLAYWESMGISNLDATYQVLLENTYSEQKNGKMSAQSRVLRYGVHDLHEYRGKFFPQLVKSFINIAKLNEGGVVLDPFCGSGTTNCEARSMGMRTIGVDLNPLSVKISKAKTGLIGYNPQVLMDIFEKIEQFLVSNNESKNNVHPKWTEKDYKYLLRWFNADALNDIHDVIFAIDMNCENIEKEFFEVCLSNIIRSVSWQKESDLRVRKEIKQYSKGDTINLFLEESNRQLRRIVPYLRVLNDKKDYPTYGNFSL